MNIKYLRGIFHQVVLLLSSFLLLVACESEKETAGKYSSKQEKQTPIVNTSAAVAASDSSGDITKGEKLFIQCRSCHTLEKGGADLIGPNLWGLLSRGAGKKEDYRYSDGLAQADFSWNLETLEQFIASPNSVVPNTTMIFAGVPRADMRQDLLAYLIQATSPP